MIDTNESEIKDHWVDGDTVIASIVCPTYNQKDYIIEALDSFLSQKTNFRFEVVVHDDASTDGTTEIVQCYAARYPNIIRLIVQTENQYSQGKRVLQLALKHARGIFVALCDGDDYWDDVEKLQKQVDFLQNNPEYVITYHRAIPFDKNGFIDENYGGATTNLTATDLQRAEAIFTLTACFRNVIRQFPPEFGSARLGDLFLWSLLGHYGDGYFISDIKPARYRVHLEGTFSKKDKQDKSLMIFVTYAALVSYYSRIGEYTLARHFLTKSIKTIVVALTPLGTVKIIARGLLRMLFIRTKRIFE